MKFFKNGNKASFYNILSNDSVDYLRLPPAFANKYLEKNNSNKKKQTVVLKTKSGKKWRVEYLKMEDRYFLMDGWLNFMKDNHLQASDFLVFWLVSPSPRLIFRVFCYAPNGCLKNTTSSSASGVDRQGPPTDGHSSDDEGVEKNPEEIGDGDFLENLQHTFTKVFKKSHTHRMPMKKSFVLATGIDSYPCVQLRNDDGKMWKVNVTKYESRQVSQMTSGWVDFRKHNKIMIGDMCEFYHVKANLLHVHVKKQPVVNEETNDDSDSVINKRVCKEETSDDDDSIKNVQDRFKSDNPFYMITLTKSYLRSSGVNVPRRFCRRYLTSEEKCVNCVLQKSDGKKIGAFKCKEYATYARVIGNNWKKFCDKDRLRVGDVCVFELINGTEKVFKVTVLRVRA